MLTYNNCKKVIENTTCVSIEQKEEMQNKLDVFFLAKRITQEQYMELTELLESKPIAS